MLTNRKRGETFFMGYYNSGDVATRKFLGLNQSTHTPTCCDASRSTPCCCCCRAFRLPLLPIAWAAAARASATVLIPMRKSRAWVSVYACEHVYVLQASSGQLNQSSLRTHLIAASSLLPSSRAVSPSIRPSSLTSLCSSSTWIIGVELG